MMPYVLPYESAVPQFAGAPLHCGPRAAVLGRVWIGRGAWLGAQAAMRGDGHEVVAGDDLHLGPRATVHISHELYPALIGNRVTIGANAVIHACTVGDDAVVEDDVVILDGSVVEAGAVVVAGSTVFQQSRLAAGQLHAGSPAKPIRALAAGEAQARGEAIRQRGDQAGAAPLQGRAADPAGVFVAGTARLDGAIELEAGANIWFGCDLAGGSSGIRIGRNSNVQDNSILTAAGSALRIGEDSTIGHNVQLTDCTIGDRTLIGIGSRVAARTIVGDDVFLGAGATTSEGQVLESGWFFGGRPARPIARMDDRKRGLIVRTIGHYRHYAEVFRRAAG